MSGYSQCALLTRLNLLNLRLDRKATVPCHKLLLFGKFLSVLFLHVVVQIGVPNTERNVNSLAERKETSFEINKISLGNSYSNV
jgi:hypothetical protein